MTTTPLDEVDDRILLRRHVAGDREAFGEVYRRHRDRMWAVAVGVCGDRELAAEAVQDVPELQLLDTPLRQRKALANASSAGLHITELRPSDPKACHEVAAIVAAIYSA